MNFDNYCFPLRAGRRAAFRARARSAQPRRFPPRRLSYELSEIYRRFPHNAFLT
jgi:hypothetical protein